MTDESCATCATLLKNIQPIYDEKSEKAVAFDRRLACCSRVICGNCQSDNPRFKTYCAFCQISTVPSPLPQGLRDPPSYTPSRVSMSDDQVELPTYEASNILPPYPASSPQKAKPYQKTAENVLHFLDHRYDSLPSLSFRYNVPIAALRKANNITSDHLLMARRTVIIPGEFYKEGVSLSPRPVEGEDEEIKKGKVRRWMVACKVAEYDIALLYLKQANYDLKAGIAAYKEDEQWEKDHPIESSVKGKGKALQYDIARRRFTGRKSGVT